jgi:hypothetical protein
MESARDYEKQITSIDAALGDWRQGDFVLDPPGFLKRFDPGLPLERADRGFEYGTGILEQEVEGLVLLTQSCDIVRSCDDRPNIEVCPLVRIPDPALLREIKKCRRPRYAYVPGAADRSWVADLDRVMTVEKSLVARWERHVGCGADDEARRFAQALARKRARFAFPDDFAVLVAPLAARANEKHDRDTEEGRAFSSLREIRIRASPSWEVPHIDLFFWFIAEDESQILDMRGFCENWMERIKSNGRYRAAQWDLITLDDMSAREYLESDQLDLDHLSDRKIRPAAE